jgi:multidrug efflux pump
MQTLPGLTDVNTDQQNGGLEEMLTYNRVTAARLGQTPSNIDSALYSAFGQSEVSVIHAPLNQFYVVMEVAPPYWQDPSGLNNIYFISSKSSTKAGMNQVSPLTNLFTSKTSTTPLQVNHTGENRVGSNIETALTSADGNSSRWSRDGNPHGA